MSFLDNLNLGNLGAMGMMGLAYNTQKDAFGDTAAALESGRQELLNKYMPNFEFKPFTVTTGTGATTGVDASGNMGMNLSQQEKDLMNQMFAGAAQQYGMATADPTQATQDYYNQMMAATNPEMQRQRLALENRLASQGRLGVGTSMYGGTPEQLTMEKAQQEQMAKNYLAARQAANQERTTAGNLASSMFNKAYTPQTQLGNMFSTGLSGAQYKTGVDQTYGTRGLETGLSALDSILKNRQAEANLTGNFLMGLGNTMQQSVNPLTGKPISNTGLFGDTSVGDLLGGAWDWLTGSDSLFGSSGDINSSVTDQLLGAIANGGSGSTWWDGGVDTGLGDNTDWAAISADPFADI